jgi:dTDP-4-dehydrorhamnose reductase
VIRVLVTGAAGMCGRDVVLAAERRGHEVTGLGRRELDVCDAAQIASALRDLRPDVIINCAAWTDVDGAESSEEEALAVNGVAPGLLAAAAAKAGAHLVHVSTDYVFDGTAARPYVESDPPSPRTAYGRTKLAGEQAVVEAGGRAAVVRSAWLFGIGGRNFVARILALGRDGREEVTVIADQIGSPTYSGHLGPALVQVAERGLTGLMHVAGAGSCSWAELAGAAFSAEGVACAVRPITSAEFPLPAPRPAWSVLASERSDAPRLPGWREGLAAYLAELHAGVPR